MSADLVGNWSWTVWLLIPVILVLAYATARTLGPSGSPQRRHDGSRGVSAHLARSASSESDAR